MIKQILFLMILTSVVNATDILLTWETPTEREDGSAIETIDRFHIYQTTNDGSQNVYEADATSTSYQILDVQEGSYSFQISTVEDAHEGSKSPPIPLSIIPPIQIVISKPSYPTLTVKVID
jgi:hypothetical protein